MALSPGAVLGHYEVERLLGTGGMGEVYVATDLRLKRRVAVKVLSGELTADHEALARLQLEAEVLAKLGHPNIVSIFDFDGGDRAYVVMELLDGETLRDRLHQGAIPWRAALDIGAAIADGLAAAHAQGVIHRDLKPENLFICHSGQVKILDFGIARLNARREGRQEDLSTRISLTAPHQALGTLTYMSPEQLRGEDVDDTTDIFSLGCVIHEMITGEAPFHRKTVAGTHAAILGEEVRNIPEDLAPPEVSRVLANCLAKHPSERFQAARDLSLTLRGVLPASVLFNSRRPRWGPTSQWLFMALSVAAIAILVGVTLNRQPRELRSVAVMPFENNSRDKEADYLAEGIAEAIINQLAEHREIRVVPRSSAFQFKGQVRSPADMASKLGVDALVTGRLAQNGDRLTVQAELIDASRHSQVWGQRYQSSVSEILQIESNIANDVFRVLSGREPPSKGLNARRETTSAEAHRHYLKGRYYWAQRTESSLHQAVREFEAAVAVDSQYALAHAGLADSQIMLWSYAEVPPVDWQKTAKAAALRALSIDPNLAEAHTSLGAVREIELDWSGAEAEYRQAIELKPEYVTAHHWYGQLLMVRGRFVESERELLRAQELESGSAKLLMDLAILASMQRNYSRTAEICRTILSQPDTFEASTLELLALALAKQGKFEEAIVTLDKLTSVAEDASGLIARAHVLALRGQRADALRLITELERRARTEYVSPYSLAVVFATLRDLDAAFTKLQEARVGGDDYLSWLKVDPDLDPLRADPRYRELVTALRM